MRSAGAPLRSTYNDVSREPSTVESTLGPRLSHGRRTSTDVAARTAHSASGRPHAVDSTLLGLREFKKVLYFTVRVWSWTGTGMTTVKW
jgi:hypothetical protein